MMGFMVGGILALILVPAGAMMVVFGSFPGEPVVTAADRQQRMLLIVFGTTFLIAGILLTLVAIRLRPRPGDFDPPPEPKG
jgi:uncharacterized membrane protein HdeD (DUF308 family)